MYKRYTVMIAQRGPQNGQMKSHLMRMVTQLKLSLAPAGSPLQPVDMRLISAGHFAGDTALPRAGPYRVTLEGGGAGVKASTTFTFKLIKKGR